MHWYFWLHRLHTSRFGNVATGQQQQPAVSEKHLIDYEECKEDVHKHCSRPGLDLKSDMSVLECLQDVKLSETELLTAPCEHLVWEFKVSSPGQM